MAVVGAVVGGLGAAAAGAHVLVAVGVGIASAYAVDYAMDAMMEDVSVDTMGGRNVNTKETTKAREIVYGEIRKGGNILWQDVAGANNKYLYQITALAHDMCEGIEKVYLDKELVWYNGTYQGDWWQSSGGVKLDVQVRDGHRAQTEISTGSSSADTHIDYWVNDGTYKHRLQRIAYVWTRFEFDREKYPNGTPVVTALIKGRKVYDPRDSSHDADDEDTWEYTSNPVLCLLDYMRNESYGAGISMDQFDEAQIISAATFCDTAIGSPSRTRYRCDGVVNTSQSIRSNIKNILTCMNGRITYAGGKLRIEPYRYHAPHSTPLNEDIITGNFTYLAKTPRQDNYNIVKGTFVSKHIDYVKTEYPQQDSGPSNYTAVDGGEHVLNLELPFTTDTIRAQRLAKLVLLRSRMQSRIKARLNAKGLDYKVGDNVNVSNAKFGIVDNLYEITSCTIGFDSESGIYVDIEARENTIDIYNHTASTDVEYVAGEVIELPKAESIGPVLASSIFATPEYMFEESIAWFSRFVRITWAAPVGVAIAHYNVVVQPQNRVFDMDGDNKAAGGIIPVLDTTKLKYVSSGSGNFAVFIRAVNRQGLKSDWVRKDVFVGYDTWSARTEILEHFLVVDDITTPLTKAQWITLTGETPIAGDRITLIEEDDDGLVSDSILYIWDPDFEVYYRGFERQVEKNPEAYLGGTGTQFSTRNIRYSGYIDPPPTFALQSVTYESNCGANSTNCPVSVSLTQTLSGKEGLVQAQMPASFYNNCTFPENSNPRVLYKCVVRATYGSQYEDLNVQLYTSVE